MADQMTEATHNVLRSQPAGTRRGTRLREVAYRAIKDAILNAAIKPETPLVEEQLASELKISRTPVREALAILEHEGLIEVVPYQGLFVKEITVSEFLQMYEAVEVIEPELARRATQNATARDIAGMEETLVQAERYILENVSAHLSACRLFQQKMGECANNSYLTSLLISIEERSDLYLISKWHVLPADKMHAAVIDRRVILDAIRSGDPEAAARASCEHARAIRKRWPELYR